MATSRALQLSNQLASPRSRAELTAALARELGAEALLLLLEDPEVDALVPAPGLPQTLPGGRAWAELLERCRKPGRHLGEVPFPEAGRLLAARALTLECGLVFLLLGGAPREFGPDELA